MENTLVISPNAEHHHCFETIFALPPIVQVARDLTTDLICLDYVDRSILRQVLRFVSKNAGPGDLLEVLCKFSHVLLFVSLSHSEALLCIFCLSSLIDEDDGKDQAHVTIAMYFLMYRFLCFYY